VSDLDYELESSGLFLDEPKKLIKEKEIRPVDVRRAAMDLLARREHAFQELVDKLSTKFIRYTDYGYSIEKESLIELISSQILILKVENLQSADRFVESFINGRISQGKGPRRIRSELEQRRVSSDLVADYLDEDNEQWQQLAEDVYYRKFSGKPISSYQEKAKRLRFMLYRGFPHSFLRSLIT
jgi:regulatory protein